MVFSKRGRTRRKKSNSRRRRGKRRGRLVRKPIALGFPKRQMVRLKYSDTIRLDPGLATAAEYTFRCNSLFDPDFTSVGHQPRTYDQWALLYNKYTVVGAKITVKPFGPTTWENVTSLVYGIAKSKDTGLPAGLDWIDLAEQPSLFGSYRTLTAEIGKARSITQTFSLKKDLNEVPNGDNSAVTNANPTTGMNWIIWCMSPNGVDGTPVDFTVNVEYIAVLTELISVPES